MKYAIPVLTLMAGFLAGRLLKMKRNDPDEDAGGGMSVIFWVVVVVAVIGVGLGTVWVVKNVAK